MNELVLIKNNIILCNSLQLAEKFHKRHDRVIRALEDIMQNDSTQKWGEYFKITSYKDISGKANKMYYMNRDGFSLLAMGFTGKEALHWKLKYIEAFNKMEQILKEKQTELWQNTRAETKVNRLAETSEIKLLVEYAKAQGSQNADRYYITFSKLANKAVGLDSKQRDIATASQLNNLALIEHIIGNVIKENIAKSMFYKEIYKECKNRIQNFLNIAYLQAI